MTPDKWNRSRIKTKLGINPKVILAGRKVNDEMSNYFSKYFLKNLKLINQNKNPKILILGATFKENISESKKIDAVIHFAGLKAVAESAKDPLRYFDFNVLILER